MTLVYKRMDPKYGRGCPNCGKNIRFYRFGGMSDMAPHFYCNRCSNVLFRESDRDLLYSNRPGAEMLQKIAETLPACPCGGEFKAGQNPKCPHCGQEIPHQDDEITRLADPYVIVIEGAHLVTEAEKQ